MGGGLSGGEIIVDGKAGKEVGNAQPNGLIAIGSGCGDFAGVNLHAGTIVAMKDAVILPTVTCAWNSQPPTLTSSTPVPA